MVKPDSTTFTLRIQHAPLDGTLFINAETRIAVDDFVPLWQGAEVQGNVLTLRQRPTHPRPQKARLRIAIPANDNMAPLV